MSFYYLNNLRWQLWFHSPNHCATFLTMTILLSIGFFIFCFERHQAWAKLLSLVLFITIIFQECILALTYSRGGYIALVATLLLTLFVSRKRWIIVFLLSFIVILIFTANGFDRFQSVAAVDDGSIKHRLVLWASGLVLIWNNMFVGVGADNVGFICAAWYQPSWLNVRYLNLVNDYLTIAAAYGIFVLVGYLCIIIVILWLGLKVWQKTSNILLLFLTAAITAYLISAIFSTFYHNWKVFVWLCLILFGLCIMVAIAIHNKVIRCH